MTELYAAEARLYVMLLTQTRGDADLELANH